VSAEITAYLIDPAYPLLLDSIEKFTRDTVGSDV